MRRCGTLSQMIITRFAPSPTGFLHLGHAFSAFNAWRRAREAGGRFLLRLEDIDPGRRRPAGPGGGGAGTASVRAFAGISGRAGCAYGTGARLSVLLHPDRYPARS